MLKFRKIWIGSLVFGLSACAPAIRHPEPSIATLDELKNLVATHQGGFESRLSGIRTMALQETALSLGAQAGLAAHSRGINAVLEKNTAHLDKIYNFNTLILENNIIPPVLLEGRNTLKLDDPSNLRLSDRSYRILKQARFVTTPPNWRGYLWQTYHTPELPDKNMLPKDVAEREVWNKYSTIGWEQGSQQAEQIFSENLARLNQDYVGMVRYRKLLAQNMVSPPYVAKTELGVTGGGNEMHIDDRALKISALPQLSTDSSTWTPAVAKKNDIHYRDKRQLSHKGKMLSQRPEVVGQRNWHPVIETTEPETKQ